MVVSKIACKRKKEMDAVPSLLPSVPPPPKHIPLLLRRLLPSQQRARRPLRARMTIQPTMLPRARIRRSCPPRNVRAIPPIRTPGLRPPIRVIEMRTMLDIIPWAHSPLRANMDKGQHMISPIGITNPRNINSARRAGTQSNQTRRPLRTRMPQSPQMTRLVQLITKTPLWATVKLLLRIQS